MGFIALLWRLGINISGLVGQRMLSFWWNGQEDLVFWAREGNTVILPMKWMCWKKGVVTFSYNQDRHVLVLRVKAGITLMKKEGRATSKQIKTQCMEERSCPQWARQTVPVSEGHNKVEANTSCLYHKHAQWVTVASLLTLMHSLTAAEYIDRF